ncbi:hypothetical protein VPJG_00005 [Vibrio phage jenny 12G5]|nr:hypothetical protein VPJG_00005 [Vibrio phage jenny 12G5]
MTTYNSYAEAKIANPEMEVIQWNSSTEFKSVKREDLSGYLTTWSKANPADHCMTVEKFLVDGHKFVKGDVCLRHDGEVITVKVAESAQDWNMKDLDDDKRFILRAAALEEKPKRTKIEFVEVEDSIFDLRPEFEAGELFVKIGDNYEVVLSTQCLATSLAVGSCYRKVEIEIDERQEFIEAYAEAVGVNWVEINHTAGVIYDSGKFKLVNAD